MANEGIMALPQGMGMEGEAPQQTVTSADSYDAAQTALGMVDPGGQTALKEAIRQNIGDLQLAPQQLSMLIQVFEYVSQNPGEYKNLLQKMVEAGALDKGDMPPEYDPEFIGSMLAVLQEMQQMQGMGAQEPMDMSPVVEGLQPMGMASGGLADVGQYLASKGRGGDSILAHITPEEAAMLKRRGGAGTVNPATGLLEFKDDPISSAFKGIGDAVKSVVNVAKDVLKSPVGRVLGTIALATVLGPAGVGLSMGTAAGLAGAGTSLLAGGSVKEALISGAMGYIGGGGTIMGASPISAVGGYLPGAAGSALNTGLATGVVGAGIGKLGGMNTQDALQMGLMSGASAAALQGLKNNTSALNEPVSLRPGSQPAPAGVDDSGAVGSAGAIGTAQEMLNASDLSVYPNNGVVGGQGSLTNLNLNPSYLDRAVSGAKDVYNEYLSPSRPGLKPDAGIFTKYGPLALAGTAVMAATGGMEGEPANQNPAFNRNYTGSDYIRDNPNMFKGGLSRYTKPQSPKSPIVQTRSSSPIPVGQPGMIRPTGITRSPGGVAQPYNVSGLYGIPMVYGPDGQLQQPPGYAKGGDAQMTNFPRRQGPIAGPGTGTSDDIPAMLSDGEFVFTAKAVRNAGGGSRRKGAARMYKLMKKLEGGAVKGN